VRAPKQARMGVAGEPVPDDPTPAKAALGLLSIKSHRREMTGNTRSREAAGTAGGPRSLDQRPRTWHTPWLDEVPGVPPDLYPIRKVMKMSLSLFLHTHTQ
jgi:hypothetical protein